MATGDFNRDGKPDVVYQDAVTGGMLHVMSGRGDGTFEEIQQVALPLNVGARITVADLNHDGYPDLIVGKDGFYSNFVPAEFNVLLNRGDGTFGLPIASTFPILAGPETATHHVAVADFDGDGHTDFMFAASAGLVLMRGDGTGHFTPLVVGAATSYGDLQDVYLADFNEDGKPDVAMDGPFGVYYALNQGGGQFGPVVTLAQVLTNPPSGFGTGDVNGDGHQDILYNYNTYIFVAYGKGDGTFAAPKNSGVAATAPGYSYLALQDVNGDGRPDLVTSYGGGPYTQLQNSAGQFAFSYGSAPAVGDMGFQAPVFADFDGDGLGDILTGASGALVLSRGRADGTFTGARATITGGNILDIQSADLNRDGLLDVAILAGGGSSYGSLSTYLGDGAGGFTRYQTAPNPYPTFAGQSSITDFNGDGIPDIFNAGYALNGDGNGGLQPAMLIAQPPSGSRPEGFTVTADFNEDGRPDAVTTTRPGQGGNPCTLAVGLSTGAGTWNTTQITLPYVSGLFQAAICAGPLVAADFNRDGHKDLATASSASIYTFLGDGKGNFTAGQVIPIGFTATGYYGIQSGQNDLEAADLDGDGNIDLIVPIADMNVIQIFYGRGDGTFEPAVSLPTAQDVRYVTVADMNGDGIADMVLGGHALVRILHGLGGRKFEAVPTSYAGNPYPQKVRVADVNGDGNPDLLVPNGGYSSLIEPGMGFTVLLNASAPPSPDLLVGNVTCTPEPSPVGQPFTCTGSFIPAANSASPAGDVVFALDGMNAGTAVLTGRRATLVFPALVSPGAHRITASFAGDSTFRAATASSTHQVSPASATISLQGPAHVAFGQAATLQATVSGSNGQPSGTVTFNEGQSSLGQATVLSGSAVLSSSALSSGSHTIQAFYGGDQTYSSGTSNAITVVVDPQPTSISLTANPATAAFGSVVTLQATVSAAVGPLNGTVQFFDGSLAIGSAAVGAGGTARYESSTLALGPHTLTASFVATASLGASTSAGVQVNIAGIQTSTSLASTPNPSYPGQAVVLVATVFSSAPSQPLAGTVRFLDGSTNLGDVMLDARGSASLTSSTLDTGTHAIQAMYLGSGAQIASQSNVLQQVVLDSSFTATADPQQLTIQTQHHATFHLNLTSVGRFSGLVTLTCGTLPLHATCRINPLTVNLTAGGTQSASVYLDTSDVIGYASASPAPLSRRSNGVVYAVLLLPVLTGLVGWRTRPLRGGVLLLMVMSLTLLGIVGCSGKYPASVAPGGYTLHFTATSNSSPAMQTAPLSLTVTP